MSVCVWIRTDGRMNGSLIGYMDGRPCGRMDGSVGWWTDGDGNQRSRWETETYYVTETDFDYRLDMTRFIYPFGYIQPGTKAKGDSVQGQVEKYLQDTNSLKSLNMKKEIAFDFEMLRRQVYGYIRSIG